MYVVRQWRPACTCDRQLQLIHEHSDRLLTHGSLIKKSTLRPIRYCLCIEYYTAVFFPLGIGYLSIVIRVKILGGIQ